MSHITITDCSATTVTFRYNQPPSFLFYNFSNIFISISCSSITLFKYAFHTPSTRSLLFWQIFQTPTCKRHINVESSTHKDFLLTTTKLGKFYQESKAIFCTQFNCYHTFSNSRHGRLEFDGYVLKYFKTSSPNISSLLSIKSKLIINKLCVCLFFV